MMMLEYDWRLDVDVVLTPEQIAALKAETLASPGPVTAGASCTPQ